MAPLSLPKSTSKTTPRDFDFGPCFVGVFRAANLAAVVSTVGLRLGLLVAKSWAKYRNIFSL